MLVRVTPPGRSAKVFRVSGVKRSWHIDGGCAAASIPLPLSGEDAERILLARVDTFGSRGLDWSGMVWRKPRAGEPIECAGLANALTLNRRAAIYADTRTSEWEPLKFAGYTPDGWDAGQGVASLVVGIGAGAYASGTKVEYRYTLPANVASCKLSGSFATPDAKVEARLYTSATATGAGTLRATYTGGAFATTVAADTRSVRLYVGTNASYSPGADTSATFSGLVLHGVAGITALTPEAVITHNIDAMPAWAMPAGAAYRSHIGVSGVTIGSLVFDDPRTDDKRKVDDVLQLSAHHFGFYPKRIAGGAAVVPVYEPVETAPSLSLDVARLPDESLRERSADSMASSYVVAYTDENGATRYVTVADTDTANYLNRIGYAIVGAVDATFTASSTVATAAGTASAAEATRSGTEGTATVVRARLANGRQTSALSCLPGRMVRVRGLGRDRLLTVVSAEAEGSKVRVSFARKATDLAYLAGRALGR